MNFQRNVYKTSFRITDTIIQIRGDRNLWKKRGIYFVIKEFHGRTDEETRVTLGGIRRWVDRRRHRINKIEEQRAGIPFFYFIRAGHTAGWNSWRK